MRYLAILLSLTAILGFGSCGGHGTQWKVSHGRSKSVDWYTATLASSSVEGVGHEATLSMSLEGNNLSQAVKPRKDITTPETCDVWITMPCFVTADEKWSGVHMQVDFDNGRPTPIEWVWQEHSPENVVVIDGFTSGGNAGFVAAVERHRSLSLRIPCGPYDSSEVTFNIQGLESALLSAGMKK